MKLIRYGAVGQEKPGILIDEVYYDLSPVVQDIDEHFFESGWLEKVTAWVNDGKHTAHKMEKPQRLGAPVARPSKIICIGLNYADHARETGAVPPAEPVIFMKSTTALVGPDDEIMIPRDSVKTDWEVERAVHDVP